MQALSEIAWDVQAHSDRLQGWQTGEIQDLKTLNEQLDSGLNTLVSRLTIFGLLRIFGEALEYRQSQ